MAHALGDFKLHGSAEGVAPCGFAAGGGDASPLKSISLNFYKRILAR